MFKKLWWLALLITLLVAGVLMTNVAYATSQNLRNSTVNNQRSLSELEKQKIYLFEQTGFDYYKYKKLEKIVWCESKWKVDAVRINKSIKGKQSIDYGLFQVNSYYWGEAAAKLGLDYKNDPLDNIDMGLHILDKQGFNAWNWSSYCWK